MNRMLPWIAALYLMNATTSIYSRAMADVFHVKISGVDDATRDGKSDATAWKSLAFACEQVPEGKHTIELGSGTFVATRQAVPRSGVTIQGRGATGEKATRLVAASDWKLTKTIGNEDDDANNRHEYLIAFRVGQDITVRAMELSSPSAHRITGGFFCRDGKNIVLEDLLVKHFRWNGLRVEFSENVTIRRCHVEDSSSVKRDGSEGGHIRTRWIANSRIHDNTIKSTDGSGYGYKAGGHVNVRIDHNVIETGYFAIESAHAAEYGVEIDHNQLNSCISVPKPGPSQDPNEKDCRYTFWIHHNEMTDSYAIEGPRNHMRISHNHIKIKRTGGRVYTQHGGINHGPIWIDHNIIENVDRSVVWMNEGLAENIYLIHNTIVCADAGDRADFLCSSYTKERLSGWVIKNNVFIAPASQPRSLFPLERGVPEQITAAGNLFVNVNGPEAGNFKADSPRFRESGKRPWEFFAPVSKQSQLVGRGVLITEKPFWEKPTDAPRQTPDIGAVEFGQDSTRQ